MYKSIVVSCDTYYYVLAGETDIDDTARFMTQLGFGHEDRRRHRGRADRRAAVARMEAHALRRQELSRGASQVVPRRLDFRRHRPGLQRVHADAAGARDRHRSPTTASRFAPHLVKNIVNLKTGEERAVAPQPTHTISAKPRAHRLHQERARRREQGGHQRRGLRGREIRCPAARPAPRRCTRSRARNTRRTRSTSGCATTRGSSPTRRRTSRRSRLRCWWRTAASARRRPRRSRARCSTISCSGSRAGPRDVTGPSKEGEDESD